MIKLSLIAASIVVLLAGPAFSQDVKGAGTEDSGRFKFCLFSWFGLTDRENQTMRQMILNSDGSRESRTAIYEKLGEYCTNFGEGYPAVVGCLSFSEDLRDCLIFFEET